MRMEARPAIILLGRWDGLYYLLLEKASLKKNIRPKFTFYVIQLHNNFPSI